MPKSIRANNTVKIKNNIGKTYRFIFIIKKKKNKITKLPIIK